MGDTRDPDRTFTEDRPEMEDAGESELIDDMDEHDQPESSAAGDDRADDESGLDDVSAEASLPEGSSSQTGRVDIADEGMGPGANAGRGTFSRDESDSSMRDAPTDSNLQESEDPSGSGEFPTQTGGEPDRG